MKQAPPNCLLCSLERACYSHTTITNVIEFDRFKIRIINLFPQAKLFKFYNSRIIFSTFSTLSGPGFSRTYFAACLASSRAVVTA